MRCHPNNTVATFITELPEAIDLSGDWEVALTEITYPRPLINIEAGYAIDITQEEYGDYIELPRGFYASLSDVVDKLNALCPDESYRLKCNSDDDRKVTLYVPADTTLQLSSPMMSLLGFTQSEFTGVKRYDSNQASDLKLNFQHMYVYCDLVEHVIVGDSKVPLLRTVLNEKGESDVVHRSFTNLIYVPLQKKHFGTVEIYIRVDTGEPMPFAGGKSILILHFRRSSNPYFLK
jgi:hypothetical protein